MREEITRQRLELLMKELARNAPRRGAYQVYFVGGGTAVFLGWRRSTIDVDLHSDQEVVFRHIQEIKERLNINVELARPEDFVPPLRGTEGRHVFIEKIEGITFYHYDPFAQILSKIVRGFQRDLEDARGFLDSGMVDPRKLRSLVAAIPDAAYARYPALSRRGIEDAIEPFLSETS